VRLERGRWTPVDRADSIYQYVPFEVPRGARALTVRLRYDRRSAVLDLGLFGPSGFAGWSGSAREGFVVTEERATPGYLPGLPSGEWHVVTGLYRVPEGGVEFELEIDLGPAEPEAERPPPPRPERPPRRELPPLENGRRWLAGDLHSHSVHSDGTLTVAELACLARGQGLDFLAVTDHNTISHHRELDEAAAHAGVMLLRGQELTTHRGHANCLDGGWVDFRADADSWLAQAEAFGAALSINHPVAGDCAWQLPMEARPPFVEVWHSSWDGRSADALDWWAAWGAGIPVGGSDFHGFGWDAPPGSPTTWVEAEDDDVLGALRAGRVAISLAAGGPVLLRHDGELLAVGGDGATLVSAAGVRRHVAGDRARIAAGPGPYRLVDDAGQTLALVP
jgi:hypothetical protein